MSLKCHFDADGWLRGAIAITHYTSPNHYASGFADKARGMVQHTEDGYDAGTIATFMNPAAQVSAFFGVGEAGDAQQFLPVGRGYAAWAQGAGNGAWRSCECEDKTRTGDPMTAPQMTAFAQILEACSAYDGFPLQITDDPVSGRGLITHGDGGAAWGGHFQCPGDVRKSQRPQIIALAMSIRQGTASPPPPPVAPAFPYPAADYMAVASADPHCHSGYYPADQPHVRTWQQQMAHRGWTVPVAGRFDAACDRACRLFQAEKGIRVDGLVGPATWAAAWAAPVT
jgi:hypothetical protein